MSRSLLLAVVATLLPDCQADHGTAGRSDDACQGSMEMSFKLASLQPPAVDVLFVIDNSMSMTEEQALLAAAFPDLVRDLLGPSSVEDLHVGVISTDMGTGGYSIETCRDPVDGDDGILLHAPNPAIAGCDPTYPEYLSTLESTEPDIMDRLSEGFACIATLGTEGCGFEQQLKASFRALVDHRSGANTGFLRDASALVVVFVTDEEDCSVAPGGEIIFDTLRSDLGHLCMRCLNHPEMLEPVETYIEMFRTLRPDPAGLLVSFIVGVPTGPACEGRGSEISGCLEHPDMQETPNPANPSHIVPGCSSTSGEAYPGRRYVRIAQALGSSGHVRSICTDTFSPAMRDIAGILSERIPPVASVVALPVAGAPGDPGRCTASCRLVEILPEGTKSEVPQVSTQLADPSLSCDDPAADRVPADGSGWYRVPVADGSTVRTTGGYTPSIGSTFEMSCCFDQPLSP